MGERLKFMARLLDGEQIAGLCREFGFSGRAGHTLLGRHHDSGPEARTERSRRLCRLAEQLAVQIARLIMRLQQDKPGWGAPKIRERHRLHSEARLPAINTDNGAPFRTAIQSR